MASKTTREHKDHAPVSVSVVVITISDSKFEFLWNRARNLEEADDSSGKYIMDQVEKAGHELRFNTLVPDHPGLIKEMVDHIHLKYSPDCIITTGGTGISRKDVTIEAMESLYEKKLDGFGEFFRKESHDEIGPSAMLSRASAGVYGRMLIFSLPGSPNACKVGMELILNELGHLVKHLKE